MGRSIETIGRNVVYFDFIYDDSDLASEDWQDLCDNIIYAIVSKYKSFISTPNQWAKWPYRENRILLENDHVQISISEYCSTGAISIFVRDDTEYPKLAEHWLSQTWKTILQIISEYVSVIHKIGTFSNGISIYRK